MAQEKEVRIQLNIPMQTFKKRLEAAKFKFLGKADYLDIYFDTQDWSLYNQIASLRIRIVNGKDHTFTFKKVFYLPANKEPYYIEELETQFPIVDLQAYTDILSKLNLKSASELPLDFGSLTRLLIDSGFQDGQRIPKTREKYVLNDIEVTIDEIDQVGTIIEFETKESKPVAELLKILSNDEFVEIEEGVGYIWLRKTRGFTKHLENYRRFKTEPEWNVLESEKDFYKKISSKKQD